MAWARRRHLSMVATAVLAGAILLAWQGTAGACEGDGPCTSQAQLVQCPPGSTSGSGFFTFDVPKDAKNVRFHFRDANSGATLYDSATGGSICGGTSTTTQVQRTPGAKEDIVRVDYTITNSGGGNPSEQHNVVLAADWDRQSDLEVTKELVDGMDDARPLDGPVGWDAQLVFKVTITNHGPAPARQVRFEDWTAREVEYDLKGVKVVQDAGPTAETLSSNGFAVEGTWDRIAVGQTITLFVSGETFHAGSPGGPDEVLNRASVTHGSGAKRSDPDPDPHRNLHSVGVDVVEVADSKLKKAGASGAEGSASPPVAAEASQRAALSAVRVRRVQVAILRVARGARPFSGQLPARPSTKPGKCEWVASRRGNLAKRKADHGVCNSPIWLRATGTRHWKLDLARELPRGRYVVYSRATGSNGIAESNFTARDRNRRAFRAR